MWATFTSPFPPLPPPTRFWIRIKKTTSPREPAGYRGFCFCFLLHLIQNKKKTPSARACPWKEGIFLTSCKRGNIEKNSKNLWPPKHIQTISLQRMKGGKGFFNNCAQLTSPGRRDDLWWFDEWIHILRFCGVENHQIGSTRVGPLWTFHALVSNRDLGLSKVIQGLKWIVWITLKERKWHMVTQGVHTSFWEICLIPPLGYPPTKKTAGATPRFFKAESAWWITYVKRKVSTT